MLLKCFTHLFKFRSRKLYHLKKYESVFLEFLFEFFIKDILRKRLNGEVIILKQLSVLEKYSFIYIILAFL